MEINGILFALGALVSWGVGDFLIQKSAREMGALQALFFNGLIGALILMPFVDFASLAGIFSWNQGLGLLLLASLILFLTSLFNFEALKQGKLAIVEPILGLELPLTVALGVFLAGEGLRPLEYFIITFIFIGIVLAITTNKGQWRYHGRLFEKGAALAGVAAVSMALANFIVGLSSREVSPVTTIWFLNLFIFIILLIWILALKDFRRSIGLFKRYPKDTLLQGIIDNLAWLFYAYAVIYIPIGIAIAISESYIALAVILGIFVGHEKLKKHQKIGAVLAIASVLLLSYIST